MHHTAHVCDLAVTLTAVVRNTASEQLAGTWDLAAAVLAGDQRHRLLSPPEADVLGDLILGRLGSTLATASACWPVNADNQAYNSQYDTRTRSLGELLDLGPEQITCRLQILAGTSRVILPDERVRGPLRADEEPDTVAAPPGQRRCAEPVVLLPATGTSCAAKGRGFLPPMAPATSSTPATTSPSSGTPIRL